jgi:hypothetical protein
MTARGALIGQARNEMDEMKTYRLPQYLQWGMKP